MPVTSPSEAVEAKRKLEKAELLTTLHGYLELPMVVLSLIMLTLFIVELTVPLSSDLRRTLWLIQWIIWFAFVLEYVVKMSVAPDTVEFLKDNWLMSISIILPFFRIFRAFRAVRAARSLGALRVITVGNRTIGQLGILFERRRLQYVLAVVIAMNLLSGAGTYFLERNAPGTTIHSYGDGLWWAAGIITTIGTEKYPVTSEGRILAVVLMVFGISVFTYIAGSLASFFISVDAHDENEARTMEGPQVEEQMKDLMQQLEILEEQLISVNESVSGKRKRQV